MTIEAAPKRKPIPKSKEHTFARHETFHLRDGWLYKGINALTENGTAILQKTAHHELGMGINMRKSLVYWIQAAGLANPDDVLRGNTRSLALTPTAKLILEYDPYFEDVGTLWLIHMLLASNRKFATLWYWAFNELAHRDFDEGRITASAQELLQRDGIEYIQESSIRKDASCFIRTYLPAAARSTRVTGEDSLDCPLSTLGLIREAGMPGMFKFRIGHHRSLPTELFTYALYRFKEEVNPNEPMISFEDVRWKPLSPGRLLCLDDRAIFDYLEELENTTPYARMIRTAGLNVISLDADTTSDGILTAYYDSQDSR
jgi:hypothetical protein